MTDKTPKYLDLDAIEEDVEFVIKSGGKQHKLAPFTVADFVANTKLLQELPKEMTIEQEVNAVITMLIRCFPTMTREELEGMPLSKLNRILEFARENNGQAKVEEEQAAEGNPPTAGA